MLQCKSAVSECQKIHPKLVKVEKLKNVNTYMMIFVNVIIHNTVLLIYII